MVRERFYQAVEEWISYCGKREVTLSSSPEPVRDCDAYRKILLIGHDALPLIREVYDRDSSDNLGLSIVQGHGLVMLVSAIIGEGFQIPETIRGKVSKIEDYVKSWLDEHYYRG
jgi:hypothetical protein